MRKKAPTWLTKKKKVLFFSGMPFCVSISPTFQTQEKEQQHTTQSHLPCKAIKIPYIHLNYYSRVFL